MQKAGFLATRLNRFGQKIKAVTLIEPRYEKTYIRRLKQKLGCTAIKDGEGLEILEVESGRIVQ